MNHYNFFVFVFITMLISNALAGKYGHYSGYEQEENEERTPYKPQTIECLYSPATVVTCSDCTHKLVCSPGNKGHEERCPRNRKYCYKGECTHKPGPMCSLHVKTSSE